MPCCRLVRYRAFVATALLWMGGISLGCAQWQHAGSVAGQVLDGDGAPVAAARLEVEAIESGTTYEVEADAAGNFRLPELAPGEYEVAVEAEGYGSWRAEGVRIREGDESTLALRLESLAAKKAAAADDADAVHAAVRTAFPGAGGAGVATGGAAAAAAVAEPGSGTGPPGRAAPPVEPATDAGRATVGPETAAPPAREATVGNTVRDTAGDTRNAAPNMVQTQVAASIAQAGGRDEPARVEPGSAVRNTTAWTTGDAAPNMVQARVVVRTAQGTVAAEMEEQPLAAARMAGWAAFVPESATAGKVAGPERKPEATPVTASQPAGAAGGQQKNGDGKAGGAGESAASSRPATAFDTALDGGATAGQPAGPGPVAARQVLGAKIMLAEAFAPSLPGAARLSPTSTPEPLPEVESALPAVAPTEAASKEDAVGNVIGNAPVPAAGNGTESGSREEEAGESSPSEVFEPASRSETEPLTVRMPRSEDRMHGQLLAEDRDAAWGASNAYTTLTTQAADGSFVSTPYKPPDRRLQAGLQMGGPLFGEGRRDRGHWFVAVDELERNFPGMAVASEPSKFFAAPTATQMQTLEGRLQAGMGQVVNAGGAQTLYTQTMGQLSGLLGSVPRTTDQTIAFPRVDWKIGERSRVAVGYDLIRMNAMNGLESGITETWGVGSFGTRALRVDAFTAQLDTFLSPNLLHELRYRYTRDAESQEALSPTSFEQQFANNSFGAPPQIGVASGNGGFKFGTPSFLNRPAYPDEQRQEATDTLTWIHGRQEIQTGYELQYVRDLSNGMSYGNGAYTYTTAEAFVADMLSPNHCDASSTGTGDLPCWSTYRQTVGPSTFSFDTADYAGFVSDTWKVLHRLTLSFGVRYDYERLPRPNAALVNPDIPETGETPSAGNGFGPRIGFAWALPGRDTTVVRGGLGIFYGRIANATVLGALSQTGVAGAQRSYLFKPLDVGAPQFPFVFSPQPDVQVAPDATFFAKDFEHPQAEQAQLSVDHALGRDTHLTVSYQGSFGSSLPRIVDQNIDTTAVGTLSYAIDDPNHLGPLQGSYASKFYYKRLNANYQQLAAMESNAATRYQAVGVSLESRLPHAMEMHLDYRYAHAVDDNPYESEYNGEWSVLDPANLAEEHGTSNADVRDRVSGGLVLHEPWHASGWLQSLFGGYTLTGTGSFRTGMPYTMRTAGAVPSFACSYQEYLESGNDCVLSALPGVITGVPVAIGGLGASINGAGGADWLPQIGRNTYRYPSAYSADMRFAKRTPLSRRTALEMGAEAFNAFNHQNVTHIETVGYLVNGVTADTGQGRLTYLSGINGNSQFGAVTSANDNEIYRDRQIQIVMRLIF